MSVEATTTRRFTVLRASVLLVLVVAILVATPLLFTTNVDQDECVPKPPIAPSSHPSTPHAAQPEVATAFGAVTTSERELVVPSAAMPREYEVFAERPILSSELPPLGDLELSGVVVDPLGDPVSGVKVWISRFTDDETLSEEDLAREWEPSQPLTEGTEFEAAVLARPHLAETNVFGRFSIGGLPNGRAKIHAVKLGYEMIPERDGIGRVGRRAKILANPRVLVEVAVLLPDGSSPDWATVRVRRAGIERSEPWNRTDPTLSLTLGESEIFASVERDDEVGFGMSSDPLRITVDEALPRIELRLESRPVLTVNVAISTRFAFSNRAIVYCVKSGVVPSDAPYMQVMKLLSEHPDVTAKLGTEVVKFTGLAPGPFDVFATLGRDIPLFVRGQVMLSGSGTETSLALDDADESRILRVRIRPSPEDDSDSDKARTAKHESRLELVANYGSEFVPVPVSSISANNGDRALVPLIDRWSDLRPGVSPTSLTVSARTAENFASSTIGLDTKYVELTFDKAATATLEVLVNGIGNWTAEGARFAVLASPWSRVDENDLNRSRYAEVDGDGVARFAPLAPGDYALRLMLRSRAGDPNGEEIADQRIVLNGFSNAVFNVPRLCDLTVEVAGERYTKIVLLSRDTITRRARYATMEDATTHCFEHLPAGRYAVRAESESRFADAELSIPEQSFIRLELKVPNCFVVSIVDEKGILSQVGFRQGDRIVGVNGVRFPRESEKPASFPSDARTFTVARGEESLEIELQVPETAKPSDLGGFFKPTHH